MYGRMFIEVRATGKLGKPISRMIELSQPLSDLIVQSIMFVLPRSEQNLNGAIVCGEYAESLFDYQKNIVLSESEIMSISEYSNTLNIVIRPEGNGMASV